VEAIVNDRLAHLRQYVAALAADMAADGKFAARGEGSIDAAAKAILTGGGALAAQLAADLRQVGGETAAMLRPAVEGALANAANKAAQAALNHGINAVTGLFNGRARAKTEQQRKVGRALMDGAAKMGRR
jgi:hypothetical protein